MYRFSYHSALLHHTTRESTADLPLFSGLCGTPSFCLQRHTAAPDLLEDGFLVIGYSTAETVISKRK